MALTKVNDTAHFIRRMLELVRDEKLEYLDAIMKYCEETGIEVEYAAQLVKRCEPIKQMLEAELIEARVLRNPSKNAVNLTSFMVDEE